jgi:hypothetical protein
VWWSYAVGLGIGLGWNALLWIARNSRRPTIKSPGGR